MEHWHRISGSMADDPLGAVGWGLLVSFFQLFQQMMMIEFWDIWRLDMAYYYVPEEFLSSSEVRTK